MCMFIYLASDCPLPTIPWDKDRPAFHVCTLPEWGTKVTKQFKESHVYFLGSYQWCGCGFHGSSDQGRTSLVELRDYLAAAVANSRTVELWSCWAGAEDAEQLSEGVIVPNKILDPGFSFEEQQYLACFRR